MEWNKNEFRDKNKVHFYQALSNQNYSLNLNKGSVEGNRRFVYQNNISFKSNFVLTSFFKFSHALK